MVGLLGAEDRSGAVEHAHLVQHGRLVPVDVLGRDQTVLERDHRDVRDHDVAPGRGDAGREPVDLQRVGELQDEGRRANKENRRVDVRVFALDTTTGALQSSNQNGSPTAQ